MTQEQWREVPGYEGLHAVSNLGRVKRLRQRAVHGRMPGLQTLTLRPDGYLVVSLRNAAGKHRNWLVHRLVLTAFVGPQPASMHGAHVNGDRADNRLANLAWCTPKENEAHKAGHGRLPQGERNGCSKLTDETVLAIRREYAWRSPTRGCLPLARKYGLSFQHFAAIVKGDSWRHLLPKH
jgi:hypothetical protein